MNKRTPLYEKQVKLGARMVPFAGWDLPIQYTSIIEEHAATRNNLGLFDIGHMGVIEVNGAALDFLQFVTTNNAAQLADYQAQYSIACNEKGGTIDDLLVYKLPNRFIIVANASNTDKILTWFDKQKVTKKFSVEIKPLTNLTMLSLQGPKAARLVHQITSYNLSFYKKNQCFVWDKMLVSRTGYTGEDGFEFFVSVDKAVFLWEKLLSAGANLGIKPCGLGARDTLRLEAALPLYGHEYNNNTSPIETGYGWAVKFNKREFIGKAALKKQKEAGSTKKLFGIKLIDKGIPRESHEIYQDKALKNKIGQITSGTFSPTLNKPIGLCFLTTNIGNHDELYVKIRGRAVGAKIVPLPFYHRTA